MHRGLCLASAITGLVAVFFLSVSIDTTAWAQARFSVENWGRADLADQRSTESIGSVDANNFGAV